jgi:CheY-like chemotaxis protein
MEKDRLLVIDDELGPRESLRFLFKHIYDVTCVDSVDKGVAALKETAPDCIITDIKMPGKNWHPGP